VSGKQYETLQPIFPAACGHHESDARSNESYDRYFTKLDWRGANHTKDESGLDAHAKSTAEKLPKRGESSGCAMLSAGSHRLLQ
jgi:hypothetical protein